MKTLRPSSAARRIACPGSFALENLYPDEGSNFSKEGEAAHWVASEHLKTYEMPPLNSACPNGEFITGEMIEGAEIYLDEIENKVGRHYEDNTGTLAMVFIEQKISIASIHPDCEGTPDCWAYVPRENEIFIWDYKYGHSYVEVYRNWQMIEYAAGIIDHLKTLGITFDKTLVTMCIIQPRSYHRDGPVRSWQLTVDELEPYFDQLRVTEYRATQPKAMCHPSPECNFCSARSKCETLQRTALTAVDISTENIPLELPPSAVGIELAYLKKAAELLDARITGLEEEATALIKKGKPVPFFRLEQSVGRECWSRPIEEIITMGELFEIEVTKPVALITPKQAITKLEKLKLPGVGASTVRKYSEVPMRELKLVQDNSTTINKVFNSY